MSNVKLTGWGSGDWHFSPEVKGKIFEVIDYLEEKAKRERPDFLILAGDTLDKALLNAGVHGIPDFRKALIRLSKTVPILMIYGTPSHDAVDSLEIFECSTIKIIRPGAGFDFKGIRFYAIPEPSKKTFAGMTDKLIEAGQNLNQAVVNLCQRYGIDRSNFDGPAIAIGHGVIKCAGTNDETFVKRSTNYLTESNISAIGADAYVWGDIHKDIDFDLVNGGYVGSLAHTFKDTGFKPSITVLEIDDRTITRSRSPIDIVPERVKITSFNELREMELQNKLVWLEVSEEEYDSTFNIGNMSAISGCIENGSRYTYKKAVKSKIRSTEIMVAKTYKDMYKIYNSGATPEQLDACQEIYEDNLRTGDVAVSRTIRAGYFKATGLKPVRKGIGKKQIHLNWEEFSGVLAFTGPGGKSKSTIVDMATPFIEVFSQPSLFVSMFEGNDASWETCFYANDDKVVLKAFIKADNKTPTVEYYAYVNDLPVPECTKNLQPFCDFVYRTFGSPRLFSATVFRTQFDNPKTWNGFPLNPSLINADHTTLKSLVHEFAGTDKTPAVNYSKKKLKELTIVRDEKQIKADNFKDNLADKSIVESDIEDTMYSIADSDSKIKDLKAKVLDIQKDIEVIQGKHSDNLINQSKLKDAKEELSKVAARLNEINKSIEVVDPVKYEKLKNDILYLRDMVNSQDQFKFRNKELTDKYNKDIEKYSTDIETFNSEESRLREIYNKDLAEKTKAIDEENQEIKTQYDIDLSNYQVSKDNYQSLKDTYEKGIRDSRADIDLKNKEVDTKFEQDTKNYDGLKRDFDIEQSRFNDAHKILVDSLTSLNTDLYKHNSRKETLETRLEADPEEKCESCGHVSSKIQEVLTKNKEELDTILEKIKETNFWINSKEEEIKNHVFTVDAPTLPVRGQYISYPEVEPFKEIEPVAPEFPVYKKLEDVQEFSSGLTRPVRPVRPDLKIIDETFYTRKEDAERELKTIEDASENRESIMAEKTQVSNRHEELCKSVNTLESLIDDTIESTLEKRKNDLTAYQDMLLEEEKNNSSLQQKQKTLKETLGSIGDDLILLGKMITEIEEIEIKMELWASMVDAWGKDGIPAMILDNIVPLIDNEVNSLLEAYYPKLRVETSTVRENKTTGEEIEEYSINVINTEDNDTQPLHSLSGEERDFVLEALYGSFRRLNEENTGTVWLWSLKDEPDSHVSEKMAPAFWDMMEDINANTDRLVVAITHSPEAKSRLTNTLDIETI